SGGGLRFQPISFSGASIVTRTEAGGPAAITRSTRSGSTTVRPAESVTSRAPALLATNKRSEAATAPSRQNSAGFGVADKLSDGAELAACRAAGLRLDGAIEPDNLLADCGDVRTATLASARLCRHRGRAQGIIDLLDQQPGAAIRHAERSCRCRD